MLLVVCAGKAAANRNGDKINANFARDFVKSMRFFLPAKRRSGLCEPRKVSIPEKLQF
jgi:hypothetical protein